MSKDEPVGYNLCPETSDGYQCTFDLGHAGDHIAEGLPGKVLRQWPNPVPAPAEDVQKPRTVRIVTHKMARDAFRKMHDALYNGGPVPMLTIPARLEDVDMTISDYICQQESASTPLPVDQQESDEAAFARAAEERERHTKHCAAALGRAEGRLEQFLRMKNERPQDPVYWDMHEESCYFHPRYRAIRRPTADCETCRLMFIFRWQMTGEAEERIDLYEIANRLLKLKEEKNA